MDNSKTTTKDSKTNQPIPVENNESLINNDFIKFQNDSGIKLETPHIAAGGFSKIYTGISNHNRRFVIKFIFLPIYEGIDDEKESKLIIDKRNKLMNWAHNEGLILMNLKHSNSIRCYGYFEMPNSRAIILEQALNKDLNYLIRLFYNKKLFPIQTLKETFQYNDYLSENFIRYLLKQVYDVLLYLRDHNLMHGDIKLENILLGKNFIPKLADYALCKPIGQSDRESHQPNIAGTNIYLPPEALNRRTKDLPAREAFKIDYYAFGNMLFKMLYNDFPLKIVDKTAKIEYEQIRLELEAFMKEPVEYLYRKCPNRKISEKLLKLLLGLLNPDEKARFNLEQIKANGWLFDNRIQIEECVEGWENDNLKMILELQKMDSIKYMNKEKEIIKSENKNFLTINVKGIIPGQRVSHVNKFKQKLKFR
jgi:serine/threonine protein kinase